MLFCALQLSCFTNTFAIYDVKNNELDFNGTFNTQTTALDKQACALFDAQMVYVIVSVGEYQFKSEQFMYQPSFISATLSPLNTTFATIDQFTIASYQILSLQNTLLQSATVDNYLMKQYDCSTSFGDVELIYLRDGTVDMKLYPYQLSLANSEAFNITASIDLLDGRGAQTLVDQKFDTSHPDWSQVTNLNDWGTYVFKGTISQALSEAIYLSTLNLAWYEISIANTVQQKQILVQRSGARQLDTNPYQTHQVLRGNISRIIPDNWVKVADSAIATPQESGILLAIEPSGIPNPFMQVEYQYFEVELCVTEITTQHQSCLDLIYDSAELLPQYYFTCENQREPADDQLCKEMQQHVFLHPTEFSIILYLSTYNISAITNEPDYIISLDVEVTSQQYCFGDASVRLYETVAVIEIALIESCVYERQNKVVELKYGTDGKDLVKQRFFFPTENNRYDITLSKDESEGLRRQILANKSGVTLFLQNERHTISTLNNNIRKTTYATGLYIFLDSVLVCVIVNIIVIVVIRRKRASKT